MPLTETDKLFGPYGDNLKNGTISTQDLMVLLKIKTAGIYPSFPEVSVSASTPTSSGGADDFVQISSFPPSYNPYVAVSNSNHDSSEMIYDFILTLHQQDWLVDKLHALNVRLINLIDPSPTDNVSTVEAFLAYDTYDNSIILGAFLGGNVTIAKALLAYEMWRDPIGASSHFLSEQMQRVFPAPIYMQGFKLELDGIIRRFRTIIAYPALSQIDGEHAVILDDLHRKIAFESEDISIAITQLITIIKRGQNAMLPSMSAYSSAYDSHNILLNTLFLLEGNISPQEYPNKINIRSLETLKTISIPPSGTKAFVGLGAMLCALSLVSTGGAAALLPAAFCTSVGWEALGVESHPTGIEDLIQTIAKLVEADTRQRLPHTHCLEESTDSAAASATNPNSFWASSAPDKDKIDADLVLVESFHG